MLLPVGLALLVYLPTLSPTINFLDSGELTTVAWTLGIAHPPGYPLYTLLGSLFVHLVPLGSVAWRMNLLSALFATLAVGLLYVLVARTIEGAPVIKNIVVPRTASRVAPAARPGGRRKDARGRAAPAGHLSAGLGDDAVPQWVAWAGGLAAAGLLAVSLTFWNWATQAKMYTLNAAFMVALFLLALGARRALHAERASAMSPSPRWSPSAWSPAVRRLHLLALTAGLALTNHYLTNLLWPGLLILLLAPAGRFGPAWRPLVRHLLTLAVAALAPLLLYLYLPIRAASHPLLDWGSPDTPGDFWRHVTVWQFRTYIGTSAGDLPAHIADAAVYAANQFGPWLGGLLLIPAAGGLVYLWRTDRALLAATALTAVLDIVYTLNYAIREVVVYYVPCYIIVLWWVGLGVGWGARWAWRQAARRPWPRLHPAAVLVPGLLLPLLALRINVGSAGHRDDYTAELYVRNAFQGFRPHAVVLTNSWDLTSGSYYLQDVLDRRTDVAVVDESLLRYPFYVDYVARRYPDLVRAVGPVYAGFRALDRRWVDGDALSDADLGRLEASYQAVLNGLLDAELGRRPAYVVFAQVGQEEQQVLIKQGPRLVPDGLGYRIAATVADRATGDPHWDLRGLTADRVPLDEVAYSVVWLYPRALSAIGTYLVQTAPTARQRQTGLRLLAQAQDLAPLAADPGERPRLR